MKYAEALARLTAGVPEDSLTNKIHNRIGAVAECLTDQLVSPALRATVVGILEKAQTEMAAAVQQQRRPKQHPETARPEFTAKLEGAFARGQDTYRPEAPSPFDDLDCEGPLP